MRVALDASLVGDRTSGVGEYITHIADGVCKIIDSELFLYGYPREARPIKHATRHSVWSRSENVGWRTLVGAIEWPVITRHHKIDIFHSPGYVLPAGLSAAGVMTIHDMRSFHDGLCSLRRQTCLRAMLPTMVRRARRILTVSEYSKAEIVHFLGVNPDHIDVTYLAPDQRFSPDTRQVGRDQLEKRYALPDRYVLSVGYIEPRKNFSKLVRAMAALRQSELDCDLVIAGPSAGVEARSVRRIAEECGFGRRLHLLDYVADEDLPALYRHASAFAFVSHYEGFGLPLVGL